VAVANVDIQVDARSALQQLKAVNQQSQQLKTTVDSATAAVAKQGRELQTAANGMRYFVDAAGRARAENGRFLSSAERAAAGIKKQGEATNSLVGVIGKLGIAFAAIQATKFVFTQAADLETQTRSLQVLTGSADKARQIIQELQQIGAVTPFTSAELIDSAKRLSAFGVTVSQVVDTTRRLGDVAGATGANLGELSLAYGQVIAKGRLQGEELLQFQERGVALQDELRKMYGLTGEEFSKALSKGQISAKAVEIALQRLTDAGGKYANGAIAQSDTLAGKLSTLQDSFQRLAQNIGRFFAPAFKFLIDGVNAVIERLNSAQRIGAEARAYQQAGERTRMRFGLRAINPFDKEVHDYQERLKQSILKSELRGAQPIRSEAAANALTQQLLGRQVGGGGGGKGEASRAQREQERAAEAAKQQQQAINTAQMQLSEARALYDIEGRILEARAAGNRELEVTRRAQTELLRISFEAQLLKQNTELPAAQRKAQLDQLAVKSATVVRQLEYDIADINATRIEQIIQMAEGYSRNLTLTQELTAEQQKQKDLADGIANTIGQGMASAFDSLIQGTENFGASLRKIASGVLTDIANQLLRVLVINQAINAISNLFGPKTGGSFLPGVKFNPSAFNMPSLLPGRATGGSVTGGQPYLVGERGPELFMPGRSGGIAPSGSFGGGPTVVVNVDASGTSVQGNQPEGQALGRAVAAAVQAELIKQKRPGGILA